MKGKFVFTKGRLTGFVCASLFPVIAVGFGVLILTNGVVLDSSFAITFLLIPLLASGLLALCIFSKGKVWARVIGSFLISGLFVAVVINAFVIFGFTQVKHYSGGDAEQQYARRINTSNLLPELSEVGEPTGIEYHNVFTALLIFSTETHWLICRYTPEEYAAQKALVDGKYIFQTETITGRSSNCEPAIVLDGYQFRLVSVEDYGRSIYYPKKLFLVGYSDEHREMIYVSFCDLDLDYITSLEDFVKNECGWKYIRRYCG